MVGKQLKTIDARIVNGFLVKDSERAIRLKSIIDVSVCKRYVFFNDSFKITVIGKSSLEEIILELGVNL